MTAWTVACLVISDMGKYNISTAIRQGGRESTSPVSPGFHALLDYTRGGHDSARLTSVFDSTVLFLCHYVGESQLMM